MKIAIFGGTFDPPHIGHLNIINEVLNANIVDKILIIPAFIPPHKNDSTITDYKARCEMTELLFKDLQEIEISKIESEFSGKTSYTINTLEELKHRNPNHNFSLLIGGDSLMNLHSWYKCENLVKNYDIYTFPRPDFKIDYSQLKKQWKSLIYKKLTDKILDFPVKKCSSSEIRKKIHASNDVSKLLTDDLWCYIINRKLYI